MLVIEVKCVVEGGVPTFYARLQGVEGPVIDRDLFGMAVQHMMIYAQLEEILGEYEDYEVHMNNWDSTVEFEAEFTLSWDEGVSSMGLPGGYVARWDKHPGLFEVQRYAGFAMREMLKTGISHGLNFNTPHKALVKRS